MREFLYRENGFLKKRSVVIAFLLTSIMALIQYESSYRDIGMGVWKYDFIIFSGSHGDLIRSLLFVKFYDFLLFFFLALFIAKILGYAIDLGVSKYYNNNIKNLSIIFYFFSIPFGAIITYPILDYIQDISIIVNSVSSILSTLGIKIYINSSGILIPSIFILTLIPFYFVYLPVKIYRRKTNNKQQTKNKKENNNKKDGKPDKKQNEGPSHLQKTFLWLVLFLVITVPLGIVGGSDIIIPEEERTNIYGVMITPGEDNCTMIVHDLGEADEIVIGDETVKELNSWARHINASYGDEIIIRNDYTTSKIKRGYINPPPSDNISIDFEKSVITC